MCPHIFQNEQTWVNGSLRVNLKDKWLSKPGESLNDAKLLVPRCPLMCTNSPTTEPEELTLGSLMFHSLSLHFLLSLHPAGRQEAIAVCVHMQTQQAVNDSLCDVVHRPPAMSQACNTEPCPPRYVLSQARRICF